MPGFCRTRSAASRFPGYFATPGYEYWFPRAPRGSATVAADPGQHNTSLRVPLPEAEAVSSYALVKPKKCRSSTESCGGIRTLCRLDLGSLSWEIAALQGAPHLRQLNDAFSSCESHTFNPRSEPAGSPWTVVQPRPGPVSGGVGVVTTFGERSKKTAPTPSPQMVLLRIGFWALSGICNRS